MGGNTFGKVLGVALIFLMMASTFGALSGTANAANPASQGKIAFRRSVNGGNEIAVVNPDGSGLVSLSAEPSPVDYQPAWSPDGTKIAFVSQRDGNEEIYIMNADGTGLRRITQTPKSETEPAWSPDDTKIAFTRRPPLWQGTGEIWVMNNDGSGEIQLTNHPDEDASPSWSPDGTKIAFVSYREGGDIWVMNANGSGQTNLIDDSDWEFIDEEPAWSPDGSKIAFAADREKRGGQDIYVMSTDGSSITRLTTPIGQNHSPSWSPDGTRIAFASNRDGNYEIYVMNADGSSETRITYDPVNESQPSWGVAADTGVIEEKPVIGPVSSIDFGNVILGSSLDETTTIYNEGNATLTVNSVTRSSGSSDFTYISPSTPFDIAAGGSQRVTIRFAPSSDGSKSAIFNVNSNDPDEASVTLNVSGSSLTQVGTTNVTSEPSGASFTLSGPADYSGTTPWSKTDTPVGTYTITWGSIGGYQTPPQESKTLTQGRTISFYSPYAPTEAFLGASAATLSEYYSAWGKELPPLSERAKMYEALGLGSTSDYAGTPEQNAQLLEVFKQEGICPSTATEIGWTALPTTVAQLIQQETLHQVWVTIGGENYSIVTLARYIDPETLECSTVPQEVKVYTDAEGNPVSDPDIAQRIGIIDLARRFQEGLGSVDSLSERIDAIMERLRIHAEIQVWETALSLTSQSLAVAIRAYLTSGESLPQDTLSAASDTLIELIGDPINVIEFIVYMDFYDAQAAYMHARALADAEIGDYRNAHSYLQHLLEAQFGYEVPAWHLLDNIDDIQKGMGAELMDFATQVADSVAGGYYGDVEKVLNTITEIQWVGQYAEEKFQGLRQVEDYLSNLSYSAKYSLDLAGSPRIVVNVHSPVELRVYDSQGRVTGIVNGEAKSEIPYSIYHEHTVTIFAPTDTYTYQIAGTAEGSYGVTVTKATEQEAVSVTAPRAPVSVQAIHEYTIDWQALLEGEKGITLKIDSDGDGTFERVINLSGIEEEKRGLPAWAWGAIGVVIGLISVLVVKPRMARKQHRSV